MQTKSAILTETRRSLQSSQSSRSCAALDDDCVHSLRLPPCVIQTAYTCSCSLREQEQEGERIQTGGMPSKYPST
jgi:hypothetical protein